MKLPPFEYRRPTTLEEAIAILSDHDGAARPIAGGQSLIPILAFRLAAPSILVDLRDVPGLGDISLDGNGVRLGAMVRYRDIEDDTHLASAWPLLPAAVAHVAHYQIRNRGTVGGSLAHADPAAEIPGIAVTADATIEIAGRDGYREIPASDLFSGALTTSLSTDELIIAVRLPPWLPDRRWAFEEFSLRRGDFAVVAVALYFDEDDDGHIVNAHVGVIGAADRPLRLVEAERALNGSRPSKALFATASEAASAAVDPQTDIHASAAYRRSLTGTLLERALLRAIAWGEHAHRA